MHQSACPLSDILVEVFVKVFSIKKIVCSKICCSWIDNAPLAAEFFYYFFVKFVDVSYSKVIYLCIEENLAFTQILYYFLKNFSSKPNVFNEVKILIAF